MVSIKTILTTHNFLEKTSEEKKRHPKNEFQAYAYRLAHDLNDLTHLHIYMKLAKNVERSLMERAYSFVIDSTSNDKGRLFLWKLKKLRMEIQKRKDFENFDYDFVVKKMRVFRNKVAKLIVEKSDLEFGKEAKALFDKVFENKNAKDKVLVIGGTSKKFINYLDDLKLSTNVLEISKDLNKLIKKDSKSSKVKVITKDFLKNLFKNNTFSYIIIHNYWQVIPQETEITFIKEVQRLLQKGGTIIVNTKHTTKDGQEWKDFVHGKEELCYFTKSSTKTSIRKLFTSLNFKEEDNQTIDGCEYFIFN
jgi:hypothetical protein